MANVQNFESISSRTLIQRYLVLEGNENIQQMRRHRTCRSVIVLLGYCKPTKVLYFDLFVTRGVGLVGQSPLLICKELTQYAAVI